MCIVISENLQLLLSISSELNSIFSNSNPEPINVKWSKGQMVIVKYHLDNMWHRGTIIEVIIKSYRNKLV